METNNGVQIAQHIHDLLRLLWDGRQDSTILQQLRSLHEVQLLPVQVRDASSCLFKNDASSRMVPDILLRIIVPDGANPVVRIHIFPEIHFRTPHGNHHVLAHALDL